MKTMFQNTISFNKKEKKPLKVYRRNWSGNFTKMTMLPALKTAIANIKHIVSSGGFNGTALAKEYNINKALQIIISFR